MASNRCNICKRFLNKEGICSNPHNNSNLCKRCGRYLNKKGECLANHKLMKLSRIYKRYCNHCGEYYEGRGKQYCSRKCNSQINSLFKKGHKYNNHPNSIKNRFKKNMIPINKGIDSRIINECRICSKEFKSYNKNQIFCSVKCQGISYRKSNRTFRQLRKRIWQSQIYQNWRETVFKRDNYTCQECGLNNCYIEAHHIKSFKYFPSLRYNLDNGKTLCTDCHNPLRGRR